LKIRIFNLIFANKSSKIFLNNGYMKNLLLFIPLLCSSMIINAQDTLSMRTGEKIQVKVMEVGISEVKYKKLDNINGPVFSTHKSDLLTIQYENGSKDDFSSIKKIELSKSDESGYILGHDDAIKYYKGYKIAGTAVLITTALPFYGIFLGIAPAALCSSAEPLVENLDCPDLNLMKNEQYAKGYKIEAKHIKRKKILTNYLSGLAIQAGILVYLLNALTRH
jgi:hypothetical protein